MGSCCCCFLWCIHDWQVLNWCLRAQRWIHNLKREIQRLWNRCPCWSHFLIVILITKWLKNNWSLVEHIVCLGSYFVTSTLYKQPPSHHMHPASKSTRGMRIQNVQRHRERQNCITLSLCWQKVGKIPSKLHLSLFSSSTKSRETGALFTFHIFWNRSPYRY